jgi:hypothetical protein
VYGQQAGAFPHVRDSLKLDGMLFVDPTAGDGADERSSPRLLVHHARHLFARGIPVRGELFERERTTFQQLTSNLVEFDKDEIALAHHEDAVLEVSRINRERMAVVYCDDPNTSYDSTLVLDNRLWLFSERATTVITCIGANAGGVGRMNGHYPASLERYFALLDLAERERYFRRLPSLVRIPNDPGRFAYMIVGSDQFKDSMEKSLGHIAREYGGIIVTGFAKVREALRQLHTFSERTMKRRAEQAELFESQTYALDTN